MKELPDRGHLPDLLNDLRLMHDRVAEVERENESLVSKLDECLAALKLIYETDGDKPDGADNAEWELAEIKTIALGALQKTAAEAELETKPWAS